MCTVLYYNAHLLAYSFSLTQSSSAAVIRYCINEPTAGRLFVPPYCSDTGPTTEKQTFSVNAEL